jgi:hypothetical protein
MRRTRRSNRNLVKALALSLATAAVFTGSATAHVRDHAASQRGTEVSYQPDGYQPQLSGDQPLIIRDAPDGFQPQTRSVEVAAVSASSDGFAWDGVAIGLGLGVVLTMACALTLAAARNRDRVAHT